jgi:SAM-dependent methyltransferase
MSSWLTKNVMISDRYSNGKWVVNNRAHLISLIMKNLNNNSKTVLDLGSGEGTYSAQFLQVFPQCSLLVGIDISRENINQAKKKQNRKKTEFIIADGQNLPFKNLSFGAAICKDILHHADDPSQVLKELIRVSKDSVVIEANKRNIIMLLHEKYGHHHLTRQHLAFLAKSCDAKSFEFFTSYDYPFTMRLPSTNPIVISWNLAISALLLLSNKLPIIIDFFSHFVFRVLRNSYNGLYIRN